MTRPRLTAPLSRRPWPQNASQSLLGLLLRPLILPVLLLLGVALTILFGLSRSVEATRELNASQERLILVTAITKDVAQLENGERGFVITGKSSFL